MTFAWGRRACGLLVAASVGGCAIHPLPDDVTHLSTYEIVRQVRCETRNALIESMLGFLTEPRNNRPLKKVDDRSFAIGQQVAKDYDERPDSILKFDPNTLSGLARDLVSTLHHTGI